MVCWLGPDGMEVEHIILNGRPCLRVCHWVRGTRYLVAYCWHPRQVAQHVDLSELVEVVDLGQVRARRRSRDHARS
ncbi:hypothetical protein AB0B45_02740 [Nonomuraea sp. NPDC049152]|uniref:hypothetical protein n=1 Tax=Nonomuraea sp. NPDC049152 TaxID=3154350 RepID=UPI0033EB63B2